MRDWSYILDVGDAIPGGIQRTHRGLAARPGAADLDREILQTVIQGGSAGALCRYLCGERRTLSGSSKSASSSRCPRQGITLPVCDRNDGVIERGLDMGNALQNLLLYLLTCLRCCHMYYRPNYLRMGRLGPLRVRALVRVR